ncbi:MAG: 23S rRNA (guanosine(2251)-2'-O)-methyltransferase RlmB [Nitrospinota bacterium]
MEAVEKFETIYGINPISEALKQETRIFREILTARRGKDSSLQEILRLAEKKNIPVRKINDAELFRLTETRNHQGIAALISPLNFLSLEKLVEKAFSRTRTPVLALLDEIQDPGNLGSMVRSAEVLGVDGLIVTRERSAGFTPTVLKRSAGALFYMAIARVTNLSRALLTLKENGFWIAGIEAEGEQFCYDYKFDTPTAIVIGSEAKGIRRLVKKNCDTILSIPMEGNVSSLNAASAATVVFYEILRQKLKKE